MRRHLASLVLVLLLCAPLARPAAAAPFQILGPRALAMGGAGVAATDGVEAAYWNPAAYGLYRERPVVGDGPPPHPLRARTTRDPLDALPAATGLGVGGGIIGREYGDILSAVNWFLDLSETWKDPSPGLVLSTLRDFRGDGRDEVRRRVADLNVEGGGLETQANLGVMVRHDWWGIGYRQLFDLTAQAVAFDTGLGLSGLNRDALTVLFRQLPDRAAAVSPLLTRNDAEMFTPLAELRATVAAAHRKVARARFRAVTTPARQVPGLKSVVDSVWRTYDAVDTGLAVAAEANHPDGSFADNHSFVRWRGAQIDEVPLTAGLPLTAHWLVGGNLKWMEATTYFEELEVFNRHDDLNVGEYDALTGSDSDFGVDLGVLYVAEGWRAGVLARDVNSPSFAYPHLGGIDRGGLTLDPQVRAGAAWLPWRRLLVAADLDVTRNHSSLPNVASRILSTGIEYTPWSWLALRLGIIHDAEQSATGYSGGIGLSTGHLALDLALAANVSQSQIHKDLVPKDFFLNDKSIPSDVALDAALAYRF